MLYNVYILYGKKQGAKRCSSVLLFLQRIKISRLHVCQCIEYLLLEGHETLVTLVASEQWNRVSGKGMEETSISVPLCTFSIHLFVYVLSI